MPVAAGAFSELLVALLLLADAALLALAAALLAGGALAPVAVALVARGVRLRSFSPRVAIVRAGVAVLVAVARGCRCRCRRGRRCGCRGPVVARSVVRGCARAARRCRRPVIAVGVVALSSRVRVVDGLGASAVVVSVAVGVRRSGAPAPPCATGACGPLGGAPRCAVVAAVRAAPRRSRRSGPPCAAAACPRYPCPGRSAAAPG